MTPSTLASTVALSDLRVGEQLAEGGEGRVFELPLRPHLVLKSYRRPGRREFLEDLVGWRLAGTAPGTQRRVEAGMAWPTAVVLDGGGAVGLLMPRAPRRFSLRHKDGTTRLASLSYLTADPAHRAVAYGLTLPREVSAERIGLVYALARLLEAFEAGSPRVGHGDLSTKNVLWSLQRGPEVFLIDCDNCERFGADGSPLGPAGRRRAMTPNWDDPAVGAGCNPTIASDRYSLALIFLRVVGAANFPIQARQRQDGSITVDFAVPADAAGRALLAPGAPVWDLCQRGLSVADPEARPAPREWVGALEGLLTALGAPGLVRSVRAGQGEASPDPAPVPARPAADSLAVSTSNRDVVIKPVPAAPRPKPRWEMVPAETPAQLPWHFAPANRMHAPGGIGAGPGSGGGPGPGPAGPGNPILPQAIAHIRTAAKWWLDLHRRMLHDLLVAGHRGGGARTLAFCAVVDFFTVLVGLFVVAMIVAPVLGI